MAMTVYLSHATSLCGAVWAPVVAGLVDLDTVVWDFPGHGGGASLDPPIDWTRFGEFVLDVTEPGGIGVGHSMGAAALAMAQIADPSRFCALVLIEPIVFPGPYIRAEHPLSQRAGRRRRVFPSRAEAADSFRDRGAFVGWDPSAFDGYIGCGLVGDGPVALACAPEIEADIYRGSGAHATWENLGAIEVPVLLLNGADSDTITPDLARQQQQRFVKAGLETVEGAGHFLPMQMPNLVSDRVRRLASVLVDRG
jgi:pimeloyl-ACP methyl ester carboxylesterase